MTLKSLLSRETIVFLLLFFLGGIFLFTLFRHQVLEYDTFAEAARNQSVVQQNQMAERGSIFAQDKDGKLFQLATNEWRFNLLISPRQIRNPEATLEVLKKYIPDLNSEAALSQMKSTEIYVPPIYENIDVLVARKIERENLAGIHLRPRIVRVYPEGARLAPQILGFVGADGIGKYGVEAVYDAKLRGETGEERAKRDSLGRVIDVLSRRPPEPGQDLILTLDYNIQYYVEERLSAAIETFKAEKGSVIVMDPNTGAIIAAAAQPVFDPNYFNLLKGDEQWKFLFPGASNVYEAGSVIKPITMAKAINENLVSASTIETFGRSVRVLNKEIFNSEFKVHGRQSMTEVLENSDNIAMVWLSQKLGLDKQREYLTRFGFGSKTGVDLVGEQVGSIHEKRNWNALLQATAAFGQGFSTTTIQLAEAYSVLVNGGKRVTPRFVDGFRSGGNITKKEPIISEQVITPETSKIIKEMMYSVVENGHGRRARVDGVRVGGKTGTAQVADPAGGYAEDRHIGTFAGFFPVDDPKFVMVVRLDNPQTVRFAESSAAPVFGEIANWIANYYQLR